MCVSSGAGFVIRGEVRRKKERIRKEKEVEGGRRKERREKVGEGGRRWEKEGEGERRREKEGEGERLSLIHI